MRGYITPDHIGTRQYSYIAPGIAVLAHIMYHGLHMSAQRLRIMLLIYGLQKIYGRYDLVKPVIEINDAIATSEIFIERKLLDTIVENSDLSCL